MNRAVKNLGGQCQWGCESNPGYCGMSGQPQRFAELEQKLNEGTPTQMCARCGDVLVQESRSQRPSPDPDQLYASWLQIQRSRPGAM